MPKFDIIINGKMVDNYVIAKDIATIRKHIVIKQFRLKKGTARFGEPNIIN